jgi:hypothetical protein
MEMGCQEDDDYFGSCQTKQKHHNDGAAKTMLPGLLLKKE